jgi:RP/EB family microtubule-associated protein
MSGDAIGMMEGAFFVGRGELLSWANDFFALGLTKVEQCATGALYCQIIDSIYPGTVTMSKVKWGAKHDYEFVENFKVLQQAFAKNDIKRYIDVDKLIKAKYQDNLEFLQWLKKYHEINYNGEPYDALGRRKG